MALITQDFIVRSGLVVQGTASVTTSTGNTGALQVNSGAAISGSIVVGSTASIYGPTILNNTLTANGTATFAGPGTGLIVNNNALISGTFTATGASTLGATTIGGALTANGTSLFDGAVTITGTNTLTVGTGAVTFGGTLGVDGVTSITDITTAAVGGTGALVVTGGALINDNLIVKSTASSSVNTNSNSIYTLGGIGISKDLAVGGSAVITGNLTVLGTQTIINSTSTSIQDPVIDIGTNVNDSPLTGDDGYNKGIVLHYYDTDDNHMFLGRNNLTGHLVLRHNIDPGANGPIPNSHYTTNGAYATFDVGTLIANDSTNATNTTSGALQVIGGAGIGGDVFVGGGVSAATLTAGNLTAGQLVYATAGGQLVTNGALVFNTATNTLVATVTTATNLAGGVAGDIPYQTASGQTTFVNIASTSGYVLTSNGTNPYWASASGTTVGNANQANNLTGGAAYEIPYQTAADTTEFSATFQYDPTAYKLTVNNVDVYGDNNSYRGIGNADNSIIPTSGQGIELASDNYAQLNYDGVNYIYVNSAGAYVEVGSTSLQLDTSGNLTLNGSGVFTAPNVDPSNLSNGRVTYYNGSYLVDDSGLTYNGSGTLTVGSSLAISGSGGDITMTGGNITGVAGITASGTVQAGYVKPTNLTSGQITFYDGTSLTDSSSLTWDGSTLTASNISSGGTINGGHLQDDSFSVTNGVVFGNSSKQLAQDSQFTWDSGTNTLIAANVTSGGTIRGGYVRADNLTSGNVTYATTNGELTDNNNFTYDGNTLTVPDVSISGSTNATNSASGALIVTGGAGIGKDLWVGGNLNVDGTIYMQGVGLDTISSTTGTFVNVSITGAGTALHVTNNVKVGGTLTATNLTVTGNTNLGNTTLENVRATDTTVTNLTVTGDFIYTGTTTLGNLSATNFTATNITATTLVVLGTATVTTLHDNGDATIGQNLSVDGVSTFTGAVTVLDTTDSTSIDTGSIVTAGGVGIAKNLTVGDAITVGATTASTVVPALYSNNVVLASYTSPTITGTSPVNLDSYSSTTYRTARYVVQVVDGSNIHITEITVFHNGSNVYINEYGISYNNGSRGTFDATLASSTITLTFTPNPSATAMKIKVVRMGITA